MLKKYAEKWAGCVVKMGKICKKLMEKSPLFTLHMFYFNTTAPSKDPSHAPNIWRNFELSGKHWSIIRALNFAPTLVWSMISLEIASFLAVGEQYRYSNRYSNTFKTFDLIEPLPVGFLLFEQFRTLGNSITVKIPDAWSPLQKWPRLRSR